MNKLYLILIISFLLSSCYKEYELPEAGWDVFDMTISQERLESLYLSRDTSYVITDPLLELSLNSQHVYMKRLSVRGRSSLDFRRKSFSVNLEYPIYLRFSNGSEMKRLSGFKLISLCMDYTYINNRLAYGILQQAGVTPLFFKYVELRINGDTQGIYLLVEDPEERIRELGSEYIFRRDYHNAMKDPKYHSNARGISQEEYERRFKEIYDALPLHEGETLYTYLNSRINLDQYFRKMAIDYLLQNGDYTDEIFLYAQIVNGGIQYQVIPWDYDDLFRNYPHEVGRDWAVGKVFGPRSYSSLQDVLDVTGDRLVFSIEDDLDYVITTDPFLYKQYTLALAGLLRELLPSDIETLFTQIEEELEPFYEQEPIILQSKYDRRPTSRELWQQNMQERLSFVLTRLEAMNDQLNTPDQQ
jgi:spore coat protein H